ncbi:hypothetical protein ON010_g17337 [Phytophthora cinnamomi]|nr:hypothetical protein ON010_g17337 [Phytophthora cinnamomi]
MTVTLRSDKQSRNMGLPGAARRDSTGDTDARAGARRSGEGERADRERRGVPHAEPAAVRGPVARGAAAATHHLRLRGALGAAPGDARGAQRDCAAVRPEVLHATLVRDPRPLPGGHGGALPGRQDGGVPHQGALRHGGLHVPAVVQRAGPGEAHDKAQGRRRLQDQRGVGSASLAVARAASQKEAEAAGLQGQAAGDELDARQRQGSG